MLKRSSLLIFVTILLLSHILLNSFALCCSAGEEFMVNKHEQGCCICCTPTEDKPFFSNQASGRMQPAIDDCNFCACILSVTASDNYFVFVKRIPLLSLHFSPLFRAASFVDNNVTTQHPAFTPAIIGQTAECLSSVVLLI